MNLANLDCAINAKEERVESGAGKMEWGRDWKKWDGRKVWKVDGKSSEEWSGD